MPLLGEVGPGEREDQLIRSVADRDLVGVDAVQRGQFGAQRAGERVRVAVRLQGGAVMAVTTPALAPTGDSLEASDPSSLSECRPGR